MTGQDVTMVRERERCRRPMFVRHDLPSRPALPLRRGGRVGDITPVARGGGL